MDGFVVHRRLAVIVALFLAFGALCVGSSAARSSAVPGTSRGHGFRFGCSGAHAQSHAGAVGGQARALEMPDGAAREARYLQADRRRRRAADPRRRPGLEPRWVGLGAVAALEGGDEHPTDRAASAAPTGASSSTAPATAAAPTATAAGADVGHQPRYPSLRVFREPERCERLQLRHLLALEREHGLARLRPLVSPRSQPCRRDRRLVQRPDHDAVRPHGERRRRVQQPPRVHDRRQLRRGRGQPAGKRLGDSRHGHEQTGSTHVSTWST
jgi:hypothetical protein